MPNWLRQLGKGILKKCQWIHPISWKKLRMLCRCFFHVGFPFFFVILSCIVLPNINGCFFRFQKNTPSNGAFSHQLSLVYQPKHSFLPWGWTTITTKDPSSKSLFAGKDHHASRNHSFCRGRDFPVLVRCWPQKPTSQLLGAPTKRIIKVKAWEPKWNHGGKNQPCEKWT